MENHVSISSNNTEREEHWSQDAVTVERVFFLIHPGCDAISSLGIKKFTREKVPPERNREGKVERKFHYVSRHYETVLFAYIWFQT